MVASRLASGFGFDSRHYVPVLKLKRGEKRALASLPVGIEGRLTPLLEVVENVKAEPLAKHLDTAFDGIEEAALGLDRIFLDPREVEKTDIGASAAVYARARALGLSFTPVATLADASVEEALAAGGHGLALRIGRAEMESLDIARVLDTIVGGRGIPRTDVDIMIDLGPVAEMVVDGVAEMSRALLRRLPAQAEWRTLTLLGFAYPKHTDVERDSHGLVERVEWQSWRGVLCPARAELARLPTYGDGCIQHPEGVERFDPAKMRVSATIRYARSEHWLLVKGIATDLLRPSIQFPRLAAKLTAGELSSEFDGAEHCRGCSGAADAGAGRPGFGSAPVWRFLGTAHHITKTLEGIAALPLL